MGGWPAGGPPDSLLPAAVAGALAPTSARVVLLPRTTGPGVTALLPHILATLALLGLALLLGATAYESVVMAPNYERDIPDSILRAREFLVRTTPAHYFRPLSLANQLVLGRHSGRHAVGQRAEQLGLTLTQDELAQVYHAVVTMGEHRKSIGDNDIRRMVERVRSGQTAEVAG